MRGARQSGIDKPRYDDAELERAERAVAEAAPRQVPLFDDPPARFEPGFTTQRTPVELTLTSSLTLAREHYRSFLQSANHSPSTIDSYFYDLARFNDSAGSKAINQISQSDIAVFLGMVTNSSTRKRRLTSLRGLFKFLIDERHLLKWNPTEGFYPHIVPLHEPDVLQPFYQTRLLAAADQDEVWSGLAVRLMLRLGLTRGEVQQLRRDQISVEAPGDLVVSTEYGESRKRLKERRLAAAGDMPQVYGEYLDRASPADLLFSVGPQAVNAMVSRVAKRAGYILKVTPHTLRHTFAWEHAKAGATESELIKLLGLIDEPRNRASVARYLAMAAGPMRASPPGSESRLTW